MRIYLAYESSLDLLRYLRSTGDGRIVGARVRTGVLSDAVHSVSQLKGLDPTAERLLSHVNGAVHAFVPSRELVANTQRLVTHLMSGPIPAGTFLDVGHGVCVSSPRATFVQLATRLDLLGLLMVGMELCGHYSRWALPVHELVVGGPLLDAENRNVTFKLAPATSMALIGRYLDQGPGIRGAMGARTALRHLANHSASPMETAIYLQLCLPRRLGGYGLPHPVLNPALTISTPAGRQTRYPDLYWQEPSIDVEYNSDYGHEGNWSRYRDSRREVMLVCAQVTVLPLTRPQLMDPDDFDQFARGLRRLLGVRGRPLPADWGSMRTEMRHRLLISGE